MMKKNPLETVMFFLLPVLLSYVFSLMAMGTQNSQENGRGIGSPTVRIALFGVARSPDAALLFDAFSQSPVFSVDTRVTEKDRARLFSERKLDAVVKVPEDTFALLKEGKKVPVEVFIAPAKSAEEGLIRAGIEDALFVAATYLEKEAVREHPYLTLSIHPLQSLMKATDTVPLTHTTIDEQQANAHEDTSSPSVATHRPSAPNVPRVALGMIVMFIMLGLFSEAAFALDEKAWGTWGRILTLPLSSGQWVVSNMTVALFIGMAQALWLFFLVSLFIAARPDLWGLLWVSFSLVVASLGMGFFLALWVKTRTAMGILSSLFVVGTSMLGGAFWSTDLLSPTMQTVAHWMPQGWALDALALVFKGESGGVVYAAGGKLLLTGVLLFLPSYVLSKRSVRSF